MKSFKENKELYDELKNNFDSSKEQPEKFLVSICLADPQNQEFLKENNIVLKPSDWSVLTIDNQLLQKAVLRAKELGFIDAYIQNPSALKQDVDKIIKRIGQLDYLAIPYKNEKGKYLSFLFSERGYNYVIEQSGKKKELTNESDNSIKDIELKSMADRVMETFAMEDKKDEIYKKIINVENMGLSLKESLMEIFKNYSDNLDYLSSTIDTILLNNEEMAKGRVA